MKNQIFREEIAMILVFLENQKYKIFFSVIFLLLSRAMCSNEKYIEALDS